MQTKFEFGEALDRSIVYVRPVEVAELPEEVQAQVSGAKTLYSVHSAEGERLALVKDRQLAFALARQNRLDPVHAH